MLKSLSGKIFVFLPIFFILLDALFYMIEQNTALRISLVLTVISIMYLIFLYYSHNDFKSILIDRLEKYGFGSEESERIYAQYIETIQHMSANEYSPEEIIDCLVIYWQIINPIAINAQRIRLVELILELSKRDFTTRYNAAGNHLEDEYTQGYLIGYTKICLAHCSNDTKLTLSPIALYFAIYMCNFGDSAVVRLRESRDKSKRTIEFKNGIKDGKEDATKAIDSYVQESFKEL